MTTFSEIWDNEVSALAKACITEPKLVQLISKSEDYELSKEEKEYLKSISGKIKDQYGMYFISNMIFRVEHALADDNMAMARLAIAEVYTVLNSPSYFKDVFQSNENNEEWKNRAALRDGLCKLMHAED